MRPNHLRKAIRQYEPYHVLATAPPLREVPPKSRYQMTIDFRDWEEVREPRAFGPPGKRK